MNRYSPWQYAIIAIALIVGFVYAFPNFYGEAPAVQVSPLKPTIKADESLQSRVEESLRKAGIATSGVFLDHASVKVRLVDTDAQIKAKDLLQSQFGEDYVVALNLLSNSPRWLASIGALPMYLGLDLRGGVHFLLQVDMKAALDKAADRYTTDIRSLMREKKVQYLGVTREGPNVVVRFNNEAERTRARSEIGN